MKPTAVESGTLATIGYDPDRKLLQLEFRDHSVYQYFAVPADVYDALLQAPSKGFYFNRAIRDRFDYTPI